MGHMVRPPLPHVAEAGVEKLLPNTEREREREVGGVDRGLGTTGRLGLITHSSTHVHTQTHANTLAG